MDSVRKKLGDLEKEELISMILELSSMVFKLESQQQTPKGKIDQQNGSSPERKLATLSALDALAASMVSTTSSHPSSAEDIFAKYHVDEDAQGKFYESRKLRGNSNARQKVLDLFVQRIGATQGRSVLAFVRGGESQIVNNSKIFVQCVREVEARNL
jgi:hypothetical protein